MAHVTLSGDNASNPKVLSDEFNTTPDILAKVNGRGDWEPVSPKNMRYLLVPKPVPPHRSS